MIDTLSEGAVAKIGVKILTKKDRQEKMLSGKQLNKSTHMTYDITDIHKEIKAVNWYLNYGKKNLTDEQEANLKDYLSKLKARFNKLGGKKELDKIETKIGNKKIANYAIGKIS